MSETSPRTVEAAPAAESRSTRWPGLVWALPIAALLIVAYLGLRALSDRGVDVVVTFSSAAGARVGDTKVIYQGLEAGRVTKIVLARDGRHVEMTLRLDPHSRPALTTATRFWLVGAKPSLTDIASVKAALAGVTIGMAPGEGGRATRRFKGMDEPPIVDPGTEGSAYTLIANVLGPVRPGSTVLYHGQEIGKITSAQFSGLNTFRIGVFVYKPYDALIRPGAEFWAASPFQVSLTGAGFSTNIAPADTVFAGGVDFDLPASAAHATPSPAGSTFVLYKSQGEAKQGLSGPEILYTLVLKGPVGDLGDGATVKLMGFQVGEVRDNQLMFDARTGLPYSRVVAAIYPHRIGAGPADTTDLVATSLPRGATDAKIDELLAHGYRAKLSQSPPLIGGLSINLQPVKGAGVGRLGAAEPYPVIPTDVSGGDIDDLTSQADEILRKVNQMPIAAIGEDVRQITERLSGLLNSPRLTDSLAHLDSTLAQVDQMMAQVKPQVGPLIAKLNQAADQISGTAAAAQGVISGQGASQDASLPGAIQQLTEAARSIRSLSDYLGRHPEALIKGKVKDTSK